MLRYAEALLSHPDHDYFETLDAKEELISDWHGRK
jgi:hypothetical protein